MVVVAKCFSLLLVFSLRVEALSLYEYLVGVQRNNTAICCNLSAIIENPPMLTTLRQEMASPRAWRPTAQSSK